MPDGSPWPTISLVTPSFNQAPFIEETLRSVLLQGYPRLELVVIDGGSQDGTVEILRKYQPWLTYWVSEPDHGQAHAINKGLAEVITRAFRVHRLHRLEANIQPGNEPSRRLVERLGFNREGFSPRYLKIGGRWRDHERWAITREAWRAGRPVLRDQ